MMPDLWRVVAGTGHRPATRNQPDGLRPQDMDWIRERARFCLGRLVEFNGITEVWSGLALGWDMILAASALDLGLPLVAHIPYESQPDRWPAHLQAEWRRLRAAATSERVYGPNPTTKWQAVKLLHERNDGLLKADRIFACWTGKRSGGTWSAIEKAQGLGRPGVHIEPVTRRVRIVEPGYWFDKMEES